MSELVKTEITKEMIGNTPPANTVKNTWRERPDRPSQDINQPDYEFWDRARRGMARGLYLAGALLKPVNSKVASWVLGSIPTWETDNEKATEKLDEWWSDNHADILWAYEEAVSLGGYYVVINQSDASVSLVSPTAVTPIVDPDDYSQIIGYEIRQVYPNPAQPGDIMEVTDTYYADRREKTVKFPSKKAERTETFRNLIGMIPVVYIPNVRSGDEMFGRPELEPLMRVPNKSVLYRYDEILDAGLKGNVHQGQPIPKFVFKTPQSLDKFFERFGELVTDDDGGSHYEIDFASLDGVAISEGDFDYAAPPSASSDTRAYLDVLFWLVVQHCEIPEFAMGVSIASSKASAETQVEPFVKWIEKKRGHVTKWLNPLCEIVVATLGMLESFAYTKPKMVWDDLTDEDGKLKLDFLTWAYEQELIDARTVLNLAPVKLDVEAVMDAAAKEKEERGVGAEFEKAMVLNLLDAQKAQDVPPVDDTLPEKLPIAS